MAAKVIPLLGEKNLTPLGQRFLFLIFDIYFDAEKGTSVSSVCDRT